MIYNSQSISRCTVGFMVLKKKIQMYPPLHVLNNTKRDIRN